MNYFIANLAAHIAYFFPFVFSVIAIVLGCRYAGPRLFDIDSVLNEKYYSYSGTVSEVSPLKNYFEIDGEHYYMNPLRNNIDEGDVVRIRFTPYAKYVVEVTQLSDEVQEAEDAAE